MELCSCWSWEEKKKKMLQTISIVLPPTCVWVQTLLCVYPNSNTAISRTVFQKRACLISIYRGAAKYNISWKDNAGMICFCPPPPPPEDGAFESCKYRFSEYVYQLKCRWNDRKKETRMRQVCARRDTHSLMTGAVRFTEQLWLLTDCGRWAGLSKATTVTFNLPNPHTHTQIVPPPPALLFCPTPCMSDYYPVLWVWGLTPE